MICVTFCVALCVAFRVVLKDALPVALPVLLFNVEMLDSVAAAGVLVAKILAMTDVGQVGPAP